VDFIGIDNYMPLADWRDGDTHADASAGAIHDLTYLRGNIAGGGKAMTGFIPHQRPAMPSAVNPSPTGRESRGSGAIKIW
jgi:hypothetical protein